jgi:hypothetical protein
VVEQTVRTPRHRLAVITLAVLVAVAIVALVILAWPGHSSEPAAPTLTVAPQHALHDGETVRIRITGVGQSPSFEAAAREHPEIDPTTGDPRVVLCATPDDAATCADTSQRTSVPPSDELPVTASIEIPRRLTAGGTTRDCALDACSLQVQRTVVTGVRVGDHENGGGEPVIDGYDEVVVAAPVRFAADDVHD